MDAILNTEVPNYCTTFYPYPLYEITFPSDYASSRVHKESIEQVNDTTANLFLCGLNCIVKETDPSCRKIYIMPLQDKDPFQSKILTSSLHFILNSYPNLEFIIIPYLECIIEIRLNFGVFIFYSCTAYDDNVKKSKMENVRMKINESLSLNRWAYDMEWENKFHKPLTEGDAIYKCEDTHKGKLKIASDNKNKSPKNATLNPKNKLNVWVDIDVGEGDKDIDVDKRDKDSLSCVLLIVANMVFGDHGLARTKKNRERTTLDFHKNKPKNAPLVQLKKNFPKSLSWLAMKVLKNICSNEVVKRVVYDPVSDHQTLYCYLCKENASYPTDKCGSTPRCIGDIFTQEMSKQMMNHEHHADLESIMLSSRAVYFNNLTKNLNVIPIFPSSHIYFNSDRSLTEEKVFDEGLKFQVGTKYCSFHWKELHIVYVEWLFDKRSNGKFELKVNIYDSLIGEDENDDNILNYNKDLLHSERVKAWKEDYLEGDVKDIPDEPSPAYFIDEGIKKKNTDHIWYTNLWTNKIYPQMKEQVFVDDKKLKWYQIKFSAHNISMKPSIIKQVHPGDNTCGYISFLCFIQRSLGLEVEPISKITKGFTNFEEFHSFFGVFIFRILSLYFNENDYEVRFTHLFEETKGSPLKDRENFPTLLQSNKVLFDFNRSTANAIFEKDYLELFDFLNLSHNSAKETVIVSDQNTVSTLTHQTEVSELSDDLFRGKKITI